MSGEKLQREGVSGWALAPAGLGRALGHGYSRAEMLVAELGCPGGRNEAVVGGVGTQAEGALGQAWESELTASVDVLKLHRKARSGVSLTFAKRVSVICPPVIKGPTTPRLEVSMWGMYPHNVGWGRALEEGGRQHACLRTICVIHT